MTIRSGINLIPVSTPTLAETLTSALIPALTAAYESAPNSARVKALLFTNPHNPFARCYPADVVRGCMRFCQERNLHFVSDEVYAMSEHKGEEEVGEGFVSALGIRDVIGEADRDMKEPLGRELIDPSRVHIIWSLSKDFGSSGIRMVCPLFPCPAFISIPHTPSAHPFSRSRPITSNPQSNDLIPNLRRV